MSDIRVVQDWLCHSKILTPYGVHVRYPNELAVDETLARNAIDKAQGVFDFCITKIGLVLPDDTGVKRGSGELEGEE